MGHLVTVLQGTPTLRDITGLKLWVDASMIPQADSSAVTQWNDLSGNGFHATQGTSAKQPTLKTNILNGLPIVRFDGVDDFLAHTYDNNSQPFTCFAIAKRSAGPVAYQNIIQAGNPLITARLLSSANWGAYFTADKPSSYSIDGVFTIMSLVCRSNTDIDFVTNGTLEASAGGAWFYGAARKAIGAGTNTGADYLTGDIAEILVYNRALSTSERRRIEKYLSIKWGVAVI